MAVVVGLFENYQDADRAITKLQDADFSKDDISVVTRKNAIEGYSDDIDTADPDETNGVTAGLTGGAAIGGLAGLLAGLGAIAIPGIGPVITAGTLAATLGSTVAGAGIGAAAGGLLGALVDAGVPEEEAEWYAEGVKRGGILVSVMADESDIDDARQIIKQSGAIDIKSRHTDWSEHGWTGFDPKSDPDTRYPSL